MKFRSKLGSILSKLAWKEAFIRFGIYLNVFLNLFVYDRDVGEGFKFNKIPYSSIALETFGRIYLLGYFLNQKGLQKLEIRVGNIPKNLKATFRNFLRYQVAL